MSKIEKLPNGWMLIGFDAAFDSVSDNGSKIKKGNYLDSGKYPVIDQGESFIGGYTNDLESVIKSPLPILVFGDHTRRFKFLNQPFAPGADGVKLLSPTSIWNARFLYYQCLNLEIENKGYSRHYQIFRKKSFLLAPKNEQSRIVDKLEELFSELDAGVKELKAAQTKLSQYRQSLLKSAVEGSLTQQWRAENRAQVQETGEQLLARILKQRREQWQQQKLAEFAEKGKIPPKNWQDAYPEPVQPDTTGLPDLPEGWVWASLDMLGDIVSGVTKGTKRKAEIEMREVPYLRVANVQRGFLALDEIKTILATESDIKKYTLMPGDVLFNEGGDRDKLGRGWVWYGEVDNCIHQNHVFRMRAFVTDLVPEFISHHGNTFGKLWFQNAGKQTTNLASINKGILQKFPVPLAPAVEQKRIIELLEEELTLLAKQEEYTLAALTASEAQRKNILKSAFSGQLVPQDPNDEPASVLLEKIKQEREALAKMPKTKQIKTKSAMKKITVEELTKWVSDYEGNSFTFGELQKTFQGDYDQLKDCVFEILSAKEPILKQVFDQKLNAITFIKEDK